MSVWWSTLEDANREAPAVGYWPEWGEMTATRSQMFPAAADSPISRIDGSFPKRELTSYAMVETTISFCSLANERSIQQS